MTAARPVFRGRLVRGSLRSTAVVLAAAVLVAGCGSAGPTPALGPTSGAAGSPSPVAASPTVSPTVAASPTAVPTPSPSVAGGAAILQAAVAAPRLPAGLSRSVAFVDGDTIVLCGGLTAKGTVGDILRIDPLAGGISLIGHLAQPVHDAAGASLAGGWLVVGGGDAAPLAVIQSVSSNGGSAKLSQLPAPRADLVAATIGDSLVVAGGSGGVASDRAVLATGDGKTFRTIATLAVGVRYPAVALLDGLIYLFGGEGDAGETAAIQVIDPAHGTVGQPAKLPATRSHAAAFVLGGRIYLAGGRHAGAALADIFSFDPVTGRVSAAGKLPEPVSDAAVAVSGTHAWLLGGERSAPVDAIVVLGAPPT